MNKFSFKIWSLAILAALFIGYDVSAYATVPWLHTDGKWIRDPENNNVTLRGVSLIAINANTYPANHLPAQQVIDNATNATNGWHSTVLRVPLFTNDDVNPLPTTAAGAEADFVKYVDPAIQECIKDNVYCIIDWHTVADYLANAQNCLIWWQTIAAHYSNTPNVLFELYNEPINPSDWQTWHDFIQPIVSAVRQVAPNNLILVGSPLWDTQLNGVLSNPISGGNIVYVAHNYPASPNPDNTTAIMDSAFGNVANTYPVMVTEWGYATYPAHAPSGCAAGQVSASGANLTSTESGWGDLWKSYLESHTNVGWVAFAFDNAYWSPFMFDSIWNLCGGDNFEGQFVQSWLAADANSNQAGNPTPVGFVAYSTPSPNIAAPGQTIPIQATFTNTNRSLQDGTAVIQVVDSSGNIIGSQSFTGQTWWHGDSLALTYNWIVPSNAASGSSYYVQLFVYGTGSDPVYADQHSSIINISTVPTFDRKISTGPVVVLGGSSETINFSLTDTGVEFSNGIADLEIYDSTGKKIAQQSWTGQSWITGQTLSYTYTWPVPTVPGTYSVDLGVFAQNWQSNPYFKQASTLYVTNSASFVPQVSVSPSVMTPGNTATITLNLTDAWQALSNTIVELQVFDSNGNNVATHSWSGVNWTQNQTQSWTYSLIAPATIGTYTVELGVFGPNWSPNYWFSTNAGTFTVTSQ
jgi:hypothetical protein